MGPQPILSRSPFLSVGLPEGPAVPRLPAAWVLAGTCLRGQCPLWEWEGGPGLRRPPDLWPPHMCTHALVDMRACTHTCRHTRVHAYMHTSAHTCRQTQADRCILCSLLLCARAPVSFPLPGAAASPGGPSCSENRHHGLVAGGPPSYGDLGPMPLRLWPASPGSCLMSSLSIRGRVWGL